ncbi:ATP synthase F0 subunit B [Persephonella atlantica]|uniref:ATP synthase subunit b n=1 Tax=Persephonella atlantica TaxID=2699429 RepID=A0ABS1GKC7_9AQUI|nr:ATP synthase F0 subunit B [Persephonella atlantica]MBK3333335.1 ATP synthase F0 subunit B [Persephonella atlantica]
MKKVFPFVLGTVSVAVASGGEGGLLVWKIINTIFLVILLAWIIKKWGIQFFENRRKSIASMVEEAQKAQADSRRALEEAQAKLEDAKMKFEESLKIAEETAKKEREVALKEAREMAERIKSQAKETIMVEIKRGENELRKYAVQKAIEISEKIVKEKINPEVEKEIILKTLKSIS